MCTVCFIYILQGIPYAVPPVAELRWKPTKSIDLSDECWGDQTLLTVNFNMPCFQYNVNKTKYLGSEDCLYLNVWTPSLEKTASLDVMVYIHGGGLMTGSGNVPGGRKGSVGLLLIWSFPCEAYNV